MTTKKPDTHAILLGAHISVAGGLHLALERGAELGCTAMQIFTRNATQWQAKPLSAEEIALFSQALARYPHGPVFAHGGYLLNLATSDPVLQRKTAAALADELERCRLLQLPWVIVHPGSHGEAGEAEGIRLAARALSSALEATPGSPVRVLLENTAGQGTSIGRRFEQLAEILARVDRLDRLGVCLDTAHAFAAGYDLREAAGYAHTMAELDRSVGLGRVLAVHVNDSRRELGSRVDRHEQIGRGAIGLAAFGFLMRDARLFDVPKILETPKYDGETFMDPINLATLRRLAEASPARPTSTTARRKRCTTC